MKRLFLMVACVLLLAGPAGALTFDAVQLDDQIGGGIIWTSYVSTIRYLLGVSSTPGGPLLDYVGFYEGVGKLSLSENHVYYLYAGNLVNGSWTEGSSHQLILYTNYGSSQGGDSPGIQVLSFHVVGAPGGAPGTFKPWTYDSQRAINGLSGPIPKLYLGWAHGTADLVGDPTQYYTPPNGMRQPDGKNDIYLVLGIGKNPGNPNPALPSTFLLME
jgi:hypothetical protein